MLKHQVLPFLEDCRGAVPEERVLEHDNVMFEQQLLLAQHVDVLFRVLLVQVVHGDAL